MSAIPLWFLPLVVFEAAAIVTWVAYVVTTNPSRVRQSSVLKQRNKRDA